MYDRVAASYGGYDIRLYLLEPRSGALRAHLSVLTTVSRVCSTSPDPDPSVAIPTSVLPSSAYAAATRRQNLTRRGVRSGVSHPTDVRARRSEPEKPNRSSASARNPS